MSGEHPTYGGYDYRDALGYGDPEDDEWYHGEADIYEDDEAPSCPHCGYEHNYMENPACIRCGLDWRQAP